MFPRALLAAAILVSLLVVWSLSINPVTLWNLLPLVPVAWSAVQAMDPVDRTLLSPQRIAFSVTVLALTTVLHLLWIFDWRGTKTGSSTSGLIFLFAPLYIGVVAGVLGLAIMGGLALRKRRKARA